MPVQTVQKPVRRRKNSSPAYDSKTVKEVVKALQTTALDQAVAFEDESHDTEGKARSKARFMSLLLAEQGIKARTHVIPDADAPDSYWAAVSLRP